MWPPQALVQRGAKTNMSCEKGLTIAIQNNTETVAAHTNFLAKRICLGNLQPFEFYCLKKCFRKSFLTFGPVEIQGFNAKLTLLKIDISFIKFVQIGINYR